MPIESPLAATLSAAASLVAVLVFCTLAILREIRAGRKETGGKVDQVHEVVNGRYSAQQAYIGALFELLNAHGIPIPAPPAHPTPTEGAGPSQH